jgi:RHS repeat-associated protein
MNRLLLFVLLALTATTGAPAQETQAATAAPAAVLDGQSVTELPDGRWLRAGGLTPQGPTNNIELLRGSEAEPFPASLAYARAGHSATVLPDGTVLVFGGTGKDGQLVPEAEILDPLAGTVETIAVIGLTPRTQHSATLLPSGQVLLAGGRDSQGQVLASAQLWNPRAHEARGVTPGLTIPRYAHEAILLSTGEDLIYGGLTSSAQPAPANELFDPQSESFEGLVAGGRQHFFKDSEQASVPPYVSETQPTANATDVPLDELVAIVFNKPLPVTQITADNITLVGPQGAVPGTVSGTERGMLAFFVPAHELSPASTYTVFLTGVTDSSGQALARTSIRFTTRQIVAEPTSDNGATATTSEKRQQAVAATPSAVARSAPPATTASTPSQPQTSKADAPKPAPASEPNEDWIPQEQNRHGAWRVLGLANDPPLILPTSVVPDLAASAGVTAIAGHVLRFNGLPLGGVVVSEGNTVTTTDAQGRFLLKGVAPGTQSIVVDGRAVYNNGRHYTEHVIQVAVTVGKTTALSAAVYLPRVDPATEVAISSPLDHDIVLTHPAIPGLEVRIPKGAVLRELNGRVVTKVSITPMPVDRAPYPSAHPFPAYFTLQPGGAYVDGDPSKAIKVIYPNYSGLKPGAPAELWNYDPRGKGWQVYGHATISRDGKKVIPDESVGFRQIMTFGWSYYGTQLDFSSPQYTPPNNGPSTCQVSAADPVDCATGIFMHTVTDLTVNDVIPISATRFYETGDNGIRAFGIGTNIGYDMTLVSPQGGALGSNTEIDLVLASGQRIHYYTPAATNPWIGTNTDSATVFTGSTLNYNARTITLRDGTTLTFNSTKNQLNAIKDRAGNQVTITLVGTFITQVTSPNGRYLQFFYDPYDRVNQITDNAGRSVSYAYNDQNQLISATDADGNTEQYGYDPVTGNMNVVTDKRGNTMLQNVFDSNGRVSQQTLADGSVWKMSYALDANGIVTQTTVTDPRNYVTQHAFNGSGYVTQTILAMGQPEQQTYTYQRDASNALQSLTDALGRVTTYTHDAFGDVTSFTELSGTPNAITYTMSYDPAYHQLTSVVDPLGHTYSTTVDLKGNIVSLTDALGNTTSIAYNSEGLPLTLTDPLGNATQLAYQGADLSSVTDPLNRTSTVSTDTLGRLISAADPLGDQTSYGYDAMSRITSSTDALGEITQLAYDPNGNLLTVIDPRSVTQTFTYDVRNRRKTYQDPAGNTENYVYDGLGNLTSLTDRKGQVTAVSYDGIDRPTLITFNDNSTLAITWDGGNRPTTFVDSLNGTISRTYDGLDRLTQETTPQGQISYTYDSASRRSNMTVAGQSVVNYTFDNDNRLTQIAQGTTVLGMGYDTAGRRTSITLPNGIVAAYTFDNASQLTAISYMNGATSVGTLGYGYDLAGRRTSITGTLASWTPPNYVPSMTYDGTNRLTNWNGNALSYDNDGNLSSFGSSTYTWNARNQLTATSAGGASFAYDALGRRVSATVNGVTSSYLYDGLNPAMMSGNQTIAGAGLDEIYAQISSTGTTTNYLRDGLNSTVALTDGNANTSATYSYSPYGDSAVTGSATTPLQFTGRENDGATGLYYYRARYYSPQLGRFISEDPTGLGAGTNFYAYVDDNPISRIDPKGEFGLPGAIGGALFNVGIQMVVQGKSWKCVDLKSVAVSAIAGLFTPGWLSIGRYAAGLSSSLDGFLAENLDVGLSELVTEQSIATGTTIGIKQGLKRLMPPWTIGSGCECGQ